MYMHELGHHFALGHAGQSQPDGSFVEYGDFSCAMGYCCSMRCYNTPHSYQIGWLPVTEVCVKGKGERGCG